MSNYNIILASQSPRRQELLKSLGFNFKTITLNINEDYPENLKKEQITEYLALKKSKEFGTINNNQIVITADTIVWKDNKVLGKPKNENEAMQMLADLSNDSHFVYTSVGFTTSKGFKVFTDYAEVHFLPISEQEASYYIKNHQPFDKAGGYGIQDWIGLTKIDTIKGSYFTVMGFPTHIVYNYLNQILNNY